jgi:tetratricopeptide (TPR) repeat protein/transcriptional regulator with XRE-family HTH domain
VNKEKKASPNLLLRKARNERGWSQRILAEQLGTTNVSVSRWENESHFPTAYFVQKLCKVYDKTPAELGLVQPPSGPQEPATDNIAGEISEPDQSPPSHAPEIWNMPFAHSALFTGRECLLEQIHDRLATTGTAALTQPHALFGLGGIGKTRTAAEYAFCYGSAYENVFWMRAATRGTLAADFVALAAWLDLPQKKAQDQSVVIAAVKCWLAANERWLLILDNADNLPLAQEFLPASHKGAVLFTTRDQALGSIAASVEVEKLGPQEGALLLLRWSKRLDANASLDQAQSEERVAAERIANEMDGLPLALVQAGAYIEETGCSLEDYLSLYAAHRKNLLEWRSRHILDHPETVATTWALSFLRVEQANPVAANLLHLCAFLAADVIPEALLTRGAAALDTILADIATDPLRFNEALNVLRQYSLVQRNSKTHTLSIHRLVQTVIKESMEQQDQRLWAERTVRAVNAAFPDAKDFSAGANNQEYVPHAQECAALIERYQFTFPEAAQLLYRAGMLQYTYGFYPQSQSLHQQALAIRERIVAPDDPAIAESLNMLAILSRNQGNDEQAEKLHLQALTIREKTLGTDHPTTAISLNNLGVLYRDQGSYEQAEPFLQRARDIREQSLGAEHSATLMTLINQAKLYLGQRKYEQADQLLQQTLTTCERVLGVKHTHTSQSLNLLARLSYEQGDYGRAEVLWQRSLAITQKSLGPEHPTTAERLSDLAKLHIDQGRYTQAQSLCQRAINISEKMLGTDHPDTIAYRELLTTILSELNVE